MIFAFIFTFIVGTFIGLIIGGYDVVKKHLHSILRKRIKCLRKGIMDSSFSSTDKYGVKTNFDVQFEVGEIQRSKDKSKICVLSYSTISDKFDDRVLKSVENSWRNSNEIEWIEDSIDQIRDKKIDLIIK